MELAKQVDWKAADAHAKATGLLKQAIVDGANAYLNTGSMGLYVDNAVPEPSRHRERPLLVQGQAAQAGLARTPGSGLR